MNLAAADDIACVESDSPAAAVGVMAMKYAFSPEGFKSAIPNVETILRKMPSAEQATLVEKSYYIYRKPLRFGNVKASFHAALSLKVFGESILTKVPWRNFRWHGKVSDRGWAL